MNKAIDVRPATRDDWTAIERLFGPRGACGGCWCMWPRVTRPEFEAGKGDENRARFRLLVEAGEVHAVLARSGDDLVGWCSFGPRSQFIRFDNSRALRRERSPST